MKGRQSRRAYAFRSGGECWAFVPHPDLSGLWMRLHPAVLVASCPVSYCGATPGIPCKSAHGYVHYIHGDRRREGAGRTADLEFAIGVVATIGRP